ncbi:MAG TPA: hypothetical protein VH704_12925 [Casimicrobiaceae bacterium]|jgi:hypothetical protein|nr:hypothetical protein [Casimicrobiaceae bacterium]
MAIGPARIAKLAAWTLVAAVVCALAAAVLINLRDPEISPQARAMAKFKLPATPPEGNAYLVLLGLTAPSGVDPLAEGQRLAAEHDIASLADPFARQRPPREEREVDPEHDDHLTFAGDLDASCDIFSDPCLPFARARDQAVRALYASNRLLIDRYEQAQRMPGFAAVPIADARRAGIERRNFGRLHAVLLTVAALDAQQLHAGEACAFLRADGAFWRRVLSGAGTLGDKLTAFRALAEDVRLASELIASKAFDAVPCGPPLRSLLAPLTAEELSLADAFRMAFVPTVRMLASWPDPAISVEPESWADRHLKETPLYDLFYRRNASINRSAELYAGLAGLAAQPTPRFIAARDAFVAESDDLVSIGPSWIYNPLGKTLVSRHLPLHVDYIAHAHGVAAYVKLVRMQLELKLAAVSLPEVPQFLQRAGPDNANPLDGRPFHWDGERSSLSFVPLDRRWRRWGTSVTIAGP